jgi:hypothetical protein
MDPDPADPTSNPTPFFSDFKGAKNLFFIFFSYNLPAGTLSSVLKLNFLLRIPNTVKTKDNLKFFSNYHRSMEPMLTLTYAI